MRIIIVSGLSGSGKTIALQTLEDLDYYCVDNLPFKLIRPLAREILAAGLQLIGWRTVPVDSSVLGRLALERLPQIEQVFIGGRPGVAGCCCSAVWPCVTAWPFGLVWVTVG